jgi:hypothetical protein
VGPPLCRSQPWAARREHKKSIVGLWWQARKAARPALPWDQPHPCPTGWSGRRSMGKPGRSPRLSFPRAPMCRPAASESAGPWCVHRGSRPQPGPAHQPQCNRPPPLPEIVRGEGAGEGKRTFRVLSMHRRQDRIPTMEDSASALTTCRARWSLSTPRPWSNSEEGVARRWCNPPPRACARASDLTSSCLSFSASSSVCCNCSATRWQSRD